MNNIPIFYYHSIAPKKDPRWYKSPLTYELAFFEDFVKYLRSQNYQFLFLDEYFELRNDPIAKNKKLICLTFDDGFLDNYVFVYPVLKKYGGKGTIFVSPDYVPKIEKIRPTLDDIWAEKVKPEELETLGYCSWNEMQLMEKSGIIDIQSHTITHTKYYSSDRIREFHNPKSNYLYPIANLFPDRKPNYITDKDFISLLPFGTPFFEEKSALIIKKLTINENFEKETIELLKNFDWGNYHFDSCFQIVKGLYDSYRKNGNLIVHTETQKEYEKRVRFEIAESKKIIGKNLNKTVKHMCWPHGDYNDFCHQVAMEEGYSSSHIVLKLGEANNVPERFDRTGSGLVMNNHFLTLLKAKYKLNSYRNVFPYDLVNHAYTFVKHSSK